MSTKTKPLKGQKLFVVERAHRSEEAHYCEVSKVGRKYFTVEWTIGNGQHTREAEFYIENWCEHNEYGGHRFLYDSEQSFLDEKESDSIRRDMQHAFNWLNGKSLSLNTLRQIKALIDQETT